MASLNYIVRTKSNPAPIYIRFSAGRGNDIVIKSGFKVDPDKWSNKKQELKITLDLTKDDTQLTESLNSLRAYILKEYTKFIGIPSKDWLLGVIEQYHNPVSGKAHNLNEYIAGFISEAGAGVRMNRDSLNFSPGTVRSYKGFQNVFNEYQGVYSEDRREELLKDGKKLRPVKILDFDDIDLNFYESFKTYVSAEGFKPNTIGRFIKILKYFMQKALDEKLHNNRDFQNRSVFRGINEDAFSVYLTEEEIQTIYEKDLSIDPTMEKSRDAFIVLCETALRVSDYPKVGVSIREKNGGKLIYITQTKTGGEVIIPLSRRLEALLKKYGGNLPQVCDVYINRYIKSVASLCGINEKITWEVSKYGKRYTKTAKKWELISCHTGRRSAATNMYKAGIPTIDIMKITGHRTEAAFLKYIKINREETATRLMNHPYFRQNKLKVI